ncbi:MAG: DUF6438 domain-containing protein [Pyrinomonadaceae bacterium]
MFRLTRLAAIHGRAIALTCAAFASAGCGGVGATGGIPETATPAAAQAVPRDTVITLERTECFGTCPVYKVSVSADGTVTFDGKKNVEKKGVATGKINEAEVGRLVAGFEAVNYFSLRDAYTPRSGNCPEVATDLPSANTSITTGGKSKAVQHYHGCRGSKEELEGLTELENKIDEAADTRQWVGKSRP